MEGSFMTITLVGISPGGEYFVTRDNEGVLRRHDRFLTGDPLEIGEATLERMFFDVGLTQVNEEFESFPEIDERVQKLVPRVPFESTSTLSPAAIEDAPWVLTRWLEDDRYRPLLPKVITKMLKLPEVRREEAIVQSLLQIMEESLNSLATVSPMPPIRFVESRSFFSKKKAA